MLLEQQTLVLGWQETQPENERLQRVILAIVLSELQESTLKKTISQISEHNCAFQTPNVVHNNALAAPNISEL